jgi:hypothetical protein
MFIFIQLIRYIPVWGLGGVLMSYASALSFTESEPGWSFRGCDHSLYTASLLLVVVAWATDFNPFVTHQFGGDLLTLLNLGSSGLLLSILLGQPMGLTNKCACRSARINNTTTSYVNLESGYIGLRYAVKYLHIDLVKPTVLGCLPLLLVLFAVHASMNGLQRVRRARYVLHGRWLADIGRAARRPGRSAGRPFGDAVVRTIEGRAVG